MNKFWQKNDKKGNVKGTRLQKDETRQDLYIMFCLDCSGSMGCDVGIISESGETVFTPKIEQLNQGFALTKKSLDRFMKENTRFQIKYQILTVDTYSKPIFPTFLSVSDATRTIGEVQFKADGTTNIEGLFNNMCPFISTKHLGQHYNRPLNIILMSDGIPTNVDGYALSESQWKSKVDTFKKYLDDNDFSRNVAFYFIAIGDEAEPFGRYFAGDEHFYKVEESQSIADELDFVTRQSLADSTTIATNPLEFDNEDVSDDEDDYDYDDSDDSDDDFDDDDDDDDDDNYEDDEEEDDDDDNEFDEDDDSDEDDEDGDDGDDDGDGSLDDILNF